MTITADGVIKTLGLAPHPEGGYFRETFRDSAVDASGRAASTAIYFLLREGEVSRWHRIDAVEVWHWYAGAPLELALALYKGSSSLIRMGGNLAAGDRPQAAVPKGCWQRAKSLGSWTLVGCTVAPGFAFDGFELAPEGLGLS